MESLQFRWINFPTFDCEDMMPDRPDALLIPISLKQGKRFNARFTKVADVADELLQVDKSKGELAHLRIQSANQPTFVTRDPKDTIYFPKGHEEEGYPRYRWSDGPNGIQTGVLIEDADV